MSNKAKEVPRVTVVLNKYELQDLLTLTAGGISRLKDYLHDIPERDVIGRQFTMEQVVKLKFLLEKLEEAEKTVKKIEEL